MKKCQQNHFKLDSGEALHDRQSCELQMIANVNSIKAFILAREQNVEVSILRRAKKRQQKHFYVRVMLSPGLTSSRARLF